MALKYILKKIIHLLIIMIVISILTFALSRLIPGDAAEVLLRASGVEPTREAVERMRQNLGLNQPLILRELWILYWPFPV